MRLTNLATRHLDIPLHFLRVDGSGAITRVYENDDLPLPMDVTGASTGRSRAASGRPASAFDEQNRTTEYYQYTDTPAGTFWCSTADRHDVDGEFSITVGVPFDDARWFRGREPEPRVSTCPDEACCRRPSSDLASRWRGKAWPSARVHMQMFSPLPRVAPFPVSTTTRCTSSSTGTREPLTHPLGITMRRRDTPRPRRDTTPRVVSRPERGVSFPAGQAVMKAR
jgi:hypothetical protein